MASTSRQASTPSKLVKSTITLHVSDDHYQGSAQFQVFVDGQQWGGTYAATALHSKGAWQDIKVIGALDPTVPHDIEVKFVNDGDDGTGKLDGHDRNLYIGYVELNGERIDGSAAVNDADPGRGAALDPSAAVMLANGTATFHMTGAAPSPSPAPAPAPAPVPAEISILSFGAVGDGVTDNRAAIQAALDYAHKVGATVVVPKGDFAFHGVITVDGVSLKGLGDASVLHGTVPTDSAIVLTGHAPSIADLHVVNDATQRTFTQNADAVQARNAEDFSITGLTVERAAQASIVVFNSARGHIAGNTILDSHADSIHITDLSHDIVVEENHIERSGDDGVAVVSYLKDGGYVENVTIRDNVVLDNVWGRGLAVVGGQHVTIEDNQVDGNRSGAAGIYAAQEQYWNTYGAKDVLIEGNRVSHTGGQQYGYGGITVSSDGGDSNDRITIADNQVTSSGKDGLLITGATNHAISVHDNVIAGTANVGVDIVGGAASVNLTNNTIRDTAANAIVVTRTTGGDLTVEHNTFDNINTAHRLPPDIALIDTGASLGTARFVENKYVEDGGGDVDRFVNAAGNVGHLDVSANAIGLPSVDHTAAGYVVTAAPAHPGDYWW